MLRISVRICCPLLLASLLCAQHEATPGDIEEGQRAFMLNCAICHGPEGDKVPRVDLAHGRFRRAVTDSDLVSIIQKGIPGTAMPPGKLDDRRARMVVVFLRSLAADTKSSGGLKGDAVRGRVLFAEKGQCRNCHRVGNEGSRVGPDLSDIGSLRRAAQLEMSILNPDAEILPQNRFVHLVAKDGTVADGRLLNHDTYTIQIIDSQQKLRTLSKATLREITFPKKSPMPSYTGKLSPQEVADLVSYLATLRENAGQ